MYDWWSDSRTSRLASDIHKSQPSTLNTVNPLMGTKPQTNGNTMTWAGAFCYPQTQYEGWENYAETQRLNLKLIHRSSVRTGHYVCVYHCSQCRTQYSRPLFWWGVFPLILQTIIMAKFNPLEFTGNYSVTSKKIWVGTLAVDGWLLHLAQRGGAWAGCGPSLLYQM